MGHIIEFPPGGRNKCRKQSLVESSSPEGKELLQEAEGLFSSILDDLNMDTAEANQLLIKAEKISSRICGPGDPFWRW